MVHAAIILAGVVAVVFAGLMATQRSLYACSVCLLAVLLQTAAIFYFLGAPLVAFLQVMIYAGAVMVLVVVTIMAAPAENPQALRKPSMPWFLAVLGILAPLGEAAWALSRGGLPQAAGWGASAAQMQVGTVLFGPYAVATEAVGFLIFLSALAVVDLNRSQL